MFFYSSGTRGFPSPNPWIKLCLLFRLMINTTLHVEQIFLAQFVHIFVYATYIGSVCFVGSRKFPTKFGSPLLAPLKTTDPLCPFVLTWSMYCSDVSLFSSVGNLPKLLGRWFHEKPLVIPWQNLYESISNWCRTSVVKIQISCNVQVGMFIDKIRETGAILQSSLLKKNTFEIIWT